MTLLVPMRMRNGNLGPDAEPGDGRGGAPTKAAIERERERRQGRGGLAIEWSLGCSVKCTVGGKGGREGVLEGRECAEIARAHV